MKKVVSMVLVLALMMVFGATAMAATTRTSGDAFDSGDTANVAVTVTATEEIDIKVEWANGITLKYKWDPASHNWDADTGSTLTSLFTITNNGSQDKSVTLSASETSPAIGTATFETTGALTVPTYNSQNTSDHIKTNLMTVTTIDNLDSKPEDSNITVTVAIG